MPQEMYRIISEVTAHQGANMKKREDFMGDQWPNPKTGHMNKKAAEDDATSGNK